MIGENDEVGVIEAVTLDKFDGDPEPENLVERLYIDPETMSVYKIEYFYHGVLVRTETREVE